MIGDIREHLTGQPFRPFTVHMADGRHIHVPTSDHVTFAGTRVVVTHDDDSKDILPGLLMAGLTVHARVDLSPEPGV